MIHSVNLIDCGNGWYRAIIVLKTGSGVGFDLRIGTTTADNTQSSVGDVTKGAYVWGAQLESGGSVNNPGYYATSYIPTAAATVSRIADAVNALTGVSDLIGQTEGTLYFEGSSFADGVLKYIMSVSDNTVSNRIILLFNTSNQIEADIITGGVIQSTHTSAFFSSVNYKIAYTYQNNKAALFINGVKIGEDLTVTVPACFRIGLDRGDGTTSPFLGNGQNWTISKTALSDAEAISWTTP